MNFSTLLGNEPIKQQFSDMLSANRMPHALILEGAQGSGKGTLAQLLARAMVCRAEDGEKPCGLCLPCQKVEGGFHPDVVEISGGNTAKSFHIDEVRWVRSDAHIRPNEADRKVYILKKVHNMSDGAQNALLKILEEPPPYVFFILTCESGATLLPTILSRAPIFAMGAVAEEDAAAFLKARFPEETEEALRRAAALSDGNVGRMIEGVSGDAFREAADLSDSVARAVTAQKELDLLVLTAPLQKDKEQMRAVLSMLLLIFRDGCMCRDSFEEKLSGAAETTDILRSRLTQGQLLDMIEVVERTQSALRSGANQALLCTWFPAMLRRAAGL